MEQNYTALIELLQRKEARVSNSRWIAPTVQILSSNAGLLEEIVREAQSGDFSHRSCAGEKLQIELMKITRGLGNRGRKARVFVREYFSKYIKEYLAESKDNYE